VLQRAAVRAPRRPRIVAALREYDRTKTRYSVMDPLLRELLAVARQILNHRLADTQVLLRELARDRVAPFRTRAVGSPRRR
jgi:hypothetical protein